MRAYTLERPGIRLDAGAIRLGEEGRGRLLVRVPLPPQAVLATDIDPAGLPDLLIECAGKPTDVLLFIPDQSGFRGGWHLRLARPESEWDQIVEAKSILPEIAHGCAVIARGECAQGDAGRMGGGPELLLVLPHGRAVEIVRSGRLYGQPGVIRLENVAGSVVRTIPRDAAKERLAARKFDAITTADGVEPIEVRLTWGGGSARHRAHNWELRPHLVSGRDVHVFDGSDIPGVATVLEDVSVHSGYRSGCFAAYRVLLFPGVTLRGYEVPSTAQSQQDVPAESNVFGSLGSALVAAGIKGSDR